MVGLFFRQLQADPLAGPVSGSGAALPAPWPDVFVCALSADVAHKDGNLIFINIVYAYMYLP